MSFHGGLLHRTSNSVPSRWRSWCCANVKFSIIIYEWFISCVLGNSMNSLIVYCKNYLPEHMQTTVLKQIKYTWWILQMTPHKILTCKLTWTCFKRLKLSICKWIWLFFMFCPKIRRLLCRLKSLNTQNKLLSVSTVVWKGHLSYVNYICITLHKNIKNQEEKRYISAFLWPVSLLYLIQDKSL